MPVATGISDHIGWAEFVTLSMEDAALCILDRRRIELIEAGLASAPYHHEGLALPLAEVEPIVVKTLASVREHCRSALTELRSSFGVEAVVIESPYDQLPESVSEVLAFRPLTYAADGMLYRETLASQVSAIGLSVHRTPRKSDPIAVASQAMGRPESEVATILDGFGKSIGAAWRKVHKLAAAAALSVLVQKASRK